MNEYFSSVQTREIEHSEMSFIRLKSGAIMPASVKVKIIPSITSSVEVAGLILPKARAHLLESEAPETFLVDSDNGNLLGATDGCLKLFGIPYSLCFGNTKRSSVLNITQIFPKIQSIADIKEMKNDTLLSVLDTSMVPSIFNFEWDTATMARHRQLGKFASHWTKARISYMSKDSSFKHKMDIILVELMKATRVERLTSNLDQSNVGSQVTHSMNIDVSPVHTTSAQELFMPEVRPTNLKKNAENSKIFSRRSSLNKTRSSKGSRDGKSQTEEEIQAMIAQQEKIRRLREKRAMIDAPATSNEIFMFKFSIYIMICIILALLLMNTVVCHTIASLIEKNVQSVAYLSDRQLLFPTLGREYRSFILIINGTMNPTQDVTLGSVKSSVSNQLKDLKDIDSLSDDPMLFLVNEGISVNTTFVDFIMQSATNDVEFVPMYPQQAIYSFVSSCETLVDIPNIPDSNDLEALKRDFYFVKKNYPLTFRDIFNTQQTEYRRGFFSISDEQMVNWRWMIVAFLSAAVIASVTVFYSLWKIARSLSNISNVLSTIRISDIVRQITQLREFETHLKEHKAGTGAAKTHSEESDYSQHVEEVQLLRSEQPESPFNISPTSKYSTLRLKTASPTNRKTVNVVPEPKILRVERKKTIKLESIGSTQRSFERNLGTTARLIARKLRITSKKANKALLMAKTSSFHKKSKSSRSNNEISAGHSMSGDKSSKDRDIKEKNLLEETRVQFEEAKTNENFLSLLGWLTIACFVLAWPLIAGALVHTNDVYQRLSPLQSEIYTIHRVRSSVTYLNSFIFDVVAEKSKQFINGSIK